MPKQVVNHDWTVITHTVIRLEETGESWNTTAMLTELRLTNFKAFSETQRIPIKPLTLIFGANSSGKSSVIHSLLLANHAQASGNFDVHRPQLATDEVDLGGFRNYVHRHDLANKVTLHFESDIANALLATKMIGATKEETSAFSQFSRFGLTLSWANANGALQKAEVSLDGHLILSFQHRYDSNFSSTPLSGCAHVFASEISRLLNNAAADVNDVSLFLQNFDTIMGQDDFTFERMVLLDPRPDFVRRWPCGMGQIEEQIQGSVQQFFTDCDWDNDDKLPYWAEAQALRFNLANLVNFCTSDIAHVVASLRYIGPLRQVPARYFTESVTEDKRTAASIAAWTQLLTNRNLREDVNHWLRNRLKTPYSIELNHLKDNAGIERGIFPEFVDSQTQTKLSHRDLGFGLSQVLPVLVEAAANTGQFIAIEQPELHLHPAQQAELGDVFIESALGKRKNTFLLETHSEHLILRILRRIRETTEGVDTGLPPVRPKDVSVLYVQPSLDGAKVIELPSTPDGDFDRPWPGGFFAERFQDLP